jgi:NADH-quinone oxidoreductase subunit B
MNDGGPGFLTSRLSDGIAWARKWSLFPYPFVTACCGMEYMSVASAQADLLLVVGTISQKMAPILRRVHDQMCEPKWVVAFGVCTCTGGFYDNYATVQGIDRVIPVHCYIPGCPPRPETVLDALMKLQARIQKEHHGLRGMVGLPVPPPPRG